MRYSTEISTVSQLGAVDYYGQKNNSASCLENEKLLIYSAYRKSVMSETERDSVERMLEMIMAAKQQIFLSRAFRRKH